MTPTREEILQVLRENKERLIEKYMPENRQKTTLCRCACQLEFQAHCTTNV